MQHYVDGKLVIITGGSSGFGFEAARILLGMGAKMVILPRDSCCLLPTAHEAFPC